MATDDRFKPGTIVSVPNRHDHGQIIVFAHDPENIAIHHPRSLRHQMFYNVFFADSGDVVTYHWKSLREVSQAM